MIVGGGCSGSSSKLSIFAFFDFGLDLDLAFFPCFTGSGGALRRCRVDSGGLHNKWKRYDSRTCDGTRI